MVNITIQLWLIKNLIRRNNQRSVISPDVAAALHGLRDPAIRIIILCLSVIKLPDVVTGSREFRIRAGG